MEIETISVISALLAAVSTLFSPIRSLLKGLWNKTVGRRSVLLEEIMRELKPNGGMSLRDSLDRIEKRQYSLESFLLTQLNIYDIAIFRTDASGKVYYTNRKYHRLTGYSLAEVEGDGWVNMVPPNERETAMSNWEAAVAGQREYHEHRTLITPTGEEYEVAIAAFKEYDDEGNITGYIGVLTPI